MKSNIIIKNEQANIFFFGILIICLVLSPTAAASWLGGLTQQLKNDFTSIDETSPSVNSTLILPGVKYVKNHTKQFQVYCFQNMPKSVLQIWRSVQLVLLDVPMSYNIFHGMNETEVVDNYHSKSMLWHPYLMFSGSDSIVDCPAFSDYCVGIDSHEKYSFFLKVRTINYWKVLQMLLGVFLFLSSPDLSRNSFFHYASGITFGVFASLLILLYFFSRFIPQKSASYAVLVFGYSFVFYLLKMAWHHFHDMITTYMDFFLCYFIVTSFLSFIVCYRIGPIKNERTCKIIQWSMQALSLTLIFFSSEYRELSTAMILLILSVHVIPTSWIKWVRYQWYKCFPPKVKFLTELEYIEQGHVETKKALDNLRNFCNSPDCNAWKVIRKLKDPIRFANFIEKGSHYTDEELLTYNSEDFIEYHDNVNPDDDVGSEEAIHCF